MIETTAPLLTPAEPLVNWKNAPSLLSLKQDYQDAKPAHDAQVSAIDGWIENLQVKGKALVNTGPGNSKIVPKLIRKQAEWRYGALSEPFLSTPDLFNAYPASWEDKKAAEQNELILNHQFNVDIDRTAFIDEYIRTAVDEGLSLIHI